jgi:hypothetical protein
MLSYWFSGNNYSFLLLLSLVSHASLCRDIVKGAVDRNDKKSLKAAQEFLEPAVSFFESLADEADEIWDVFASPFRKASNAEIRDFLAEDEEEEEEEPVASHRALRMEAELREFRKEQIADRQLVAYYERMEHTEEVALESYKEKEKGFCGGGEEDAARGDGEGRDDQSENGSEDSEDEVAHGCYFEESSAEEEDDWQKGIMNKRVAKRKSQSPRNRPSTRVSLSDTKPSTRKRPAPPSIAYDDEDFLAPKPSVVRHRLAILDSEDED